MALKTKRVLVLVFMCLFSVALLNKLTSSPRSAKSHHRRQPPRDVALENSEPNRNHLESEDEESIDDNGHHDEVTLSSDHAKPTLTVEVTQADRGILYPVEVKGLEIWRELLEEGKRVNSEVDKAKHTHAFNQFISQGIGFARELPDTRPQLCPSFQYPPAHDLPTTSVVICFHNEDFTTLLRTVYSVLLQSPPALIKEVVLVDDASTMSDLHTPLDNHLQQFLPKVRVIRSKQRQGLIRARLIGARSATGDVLTFLDSHCEVNVGWLEPLLARLKEKPRSAVMPLIEIINADSLEYQLVGINLGGFSWDLVFTWDQPGGAWSATEQAKPRPSPTMAGGLFSIYRNFFFEIGSYDEGMDVWGGENLEISFRLWMCADGLELIPCSRVGHIFRDRRPYSSPGGDTFGRNSVRVVEVWLDQYKAVFYTKKSYLQTYAAEQHLEERRSLRKRLQCRSFDWYLKTVYPKAIEELKKDSALQSLLPQLGL